MLLVSLPLLARAVVDAEDAHLFVLELDLVVSAVYQHRIEFGYRRDRRMHLSGRSPECESGDR
jgi:hypothetical protein